MATSTYCTWCGELHAAPFGCIKDPVDGSPEACYICAKPAENAGEMCIDCSVSWDDHCATEYRLSLARKCRCGVIINDDETVCDRCQDPRDGGVDDSYAAPRWNEDSGFNPELRGGL